MTKKQVYIIHGYNASPNDHWFPWLRQMLKGVGIEASILRMPEAMAPSLPKWLEYLKANIKTLNEDVFFVAHSLGCVTLLNYLNLEARTNKIGGLVLVSGFMDNLTLLPELDEFTAVKFEHKYIKRLTKNCLVIAAKDDPIVPYEQTRKLSDLLDSRFISIERGGHFLASDGFKELPVVIEELQKMKLF